MSFHELKGICSSDHFWTLTSRHWEVSIVGSLRGTGHGLGRHFLPVQLRPEARQDPPPGGRGTRSGTCKVADLLG